MCQVCGSGGSLLAISLCGIQGSEALFEKRGPLSGLAANADDQNLALTSFVIFRTPLYVGELAIFVPPIVDGPQRPDIRTVVSF